MKKVILFAVFLAAIMFVFWGYFKQQRLPEKKTRVRDYAVAEEESAEEAVALPVPAPLPAEAPAPAPAPPVVTVNYDEGDQLIVPGILETYPTYTAIGIEFNYRGDTDRDAQANVVWRKKGETAWRLGVDVTHNYKQHKMNASIWPLEQGETVEIAICLLDPDPLAEPVEVTETTRTMVLENTGGKSIYVSPKGRDTSTGTKSDPLGTLTYAISLAQAGDTIYAMSGRYNENIEIGAGVRGEQGKPIIITAARGQKPVIDTSTTIKAGTTWHNAGKGVYWIDADMPKGTGNGYVSQDGKRMYCYATVDEVREDKWKNGRVYKYDRDEQRLYIRTGDANSPRQHTYKYARDKYGVFLNGCSYVVVKGLDVNHFAAQCIRLRGSSLTGNVIYGNKLHNAPSAISLLDHTTDNNAMWYNHAYEPGIEDFSWESIKRSVGGYSRQGFNIWYGGPGTSICYNKIYNWFDCIVVISWKAMERKLSKIGLTGVMELNRDCDVMFNDLWNVGDDALEMDGGGVNMRVHGNVIRNAHTAISLAPIERGPVYVTRNDATWHNLMFKLSVGTVDSTGWTYCYHNSGYSMDHENEGTMIRFMPMDEVDRNKVFMNNAMIGSEYSVHRGRKHLWLDYNCYFNTPQTGFRKFQWDNKSYTSLAKFADVSGQEKHGMYADPMFVATPDLGKKTWTVKNYRNVSVGDLRLKAGSPCIDAGQIIRGINDGSFKGKAPDIGAFEYDN